MKISIISNGYTYTEQIAKSTPVKTETKSTAQKPSDSPEFQAILSEIQTQLNNRITSLKGSSGGADGTNAASSSSASRIYPPYTGKIPETLDYASTEPIRVRTVTDSAYESIAPAEYQDIFRRASMTYGIDQKYLELIGYHESRFIPDEVSTSGAVGIMQLMPGTAASHGVTDSYDPEQNIMGAAKLVRELYDAYDGDLDLMISGYSSGMGAVRDYGGVPPHEQTLNYIDWMRQRYP